MGKQARIAAILVSALALWGCQPMASDKVQTKATVVAVGKTHLIVEDRQSVMFVDIDPSDKERLKNLKKGDQIMIVSKKSAHPDDHSVEVDEIITPDGTHIPLGG